MNRITTKRLYPYGQKYNVTFGKKCLALLRLVKNHKIYVGAKSYYPDEAHKSKVRIFCEQLEYVVRYGYPEQYYHLYGFDRKIATKAFRNEYLSPYDDFMIRINCNNKRYPYHTAALGHHDVEFGLHGRTITADKYYFGAMLGPLGFPVPTTICYIRKGQVLYAQGKTQKELMQEKAEDTLTALLKKDMDAFCKPCDGECGKGIFSLRIEGGKILCGGAEATDKEVIMRLLSADYLIQTRLIQHPVLQALNPSCFNTIRLQTVIKPDGDVLPFGALLRIGAKGCEVDNWAKGGFCVGIDMKTGKLMGDGFLKPQYGTTASIHPDTGIVFDGYEIPYFKEAVEAACNAHRHLYHTHSIGWDIAITPNGPAFIEANSLWEISLVQAVHGGLSKEVEEYFDI